MEFIKKDRSVLVPVGTWFGNAPDLMKGGKNTDIGALAECLIYYDTIFVNVNLPEHFYDIFQWFKRSGCEDSFLDLLKNGEVFFYFYNFYVNPMYYDKRKAYIFLNVQEATKSRMDLFYRHIVKSLDRYFDSYRKRKSFEEVLETSVIVVKADSFGKCVTDAQDYIIRAENYKLLVETLLESMKDAGFITEYPNLTVKEVMSWLGQPGINVNIDFKQIGKKIGEKYNFGDHIPFAIASTTNRFLWSAATQGTDLYVSAPMFSFLDKKMDETILHFKGAKDNLEKLNIEVDFPDIRSEVNWGLISANEVLKIRKCSSNFRTWLHTQTDLNREIVSAFHNDVIEQCGLKPHTKKKIKNLLLVTSVLSGSILGASTNGTSGAVVGGLTAAASQFLVDIYEKLTSGWNPRIFGEKVRRIKEN